MDKTAGLFHEEWLTQWFSHDTHEVTSLVYSTVHQPQIFYHDFSINYWNDKIEIVSLLDAPFSLLMRMHVYSYISLGSFLLNKVGEVGGVEL